MHWNSAFGEFLEIIRLLNRHGLISFVFHKYEATSLFDILGIRAKNEFPSGSVNFRMGFHTAIGQTAAYRQTRERKVYT